SSNDLLAYWADDPRTDVIVLYLESFGNPRRFARMAPDVAQRKPIIAVKSGRSAAGSRAAASHSAALATSDIAVEALFEQAGVIRANTLQERAQLRVRGLGQDEQGLKASVDPSESQVQEMVETVLTPAHPDPLEPLLNQPCARTLHHPRAQRQAQCLVHGRVDVLAMPFQIRI